MAWLLVLSLLGFSLIPWTLVGLIRWLHDARRSRAASREARLEHPSAPCEGHGLTATDVAVLIPAHNEEAGIAATIGSALRLVPRSNIHIVADGCEDATAAIAAAFGVNVLAIDPGRGKASGLVAAIGHFSIEERFAVALIVDADTEVSPNYLARGLRLLDDEDVAAVAGYARSGWAPRRTTLLGRLLIAYRARWYVVTQWLRFAQTWRYTNVTPLVPGFASMYRTRVLARMEIDAPGLVVEDANMTFELRHKRLGKVALDPKASAITQDPDNLPDYFRQMSRWSLGLLQAIRRHRLWPSGFCVNLTVTLTEALVAHVVLLGLVIGILIMAVDALTGGGAHSSRSFAGAWDALAPVVTPLNMLLLVVVPDYLLTCLAAAHLRRPSLLVYGPAFVVVRIVDALAFLHALLRLIRDSSDGRWLSPRRRALGQPAGLCTQRSAAADVPGSAPEER